MVFLSSDGIDGSMLKRVAAICSSTFMVPLLQRGAETLQIQLVFEHILYRHYRTVYRELDVKLQDLWTSFDDGDISASAFH
ncbi:hypothetical protein MAR_020235, partial [Mya arenaria]